MRFLCLHGAGTSSQVFEIQTAALRYELGGPHEYDFVQGTVPWSMAPELASLSPKDAVSWSYFDPSSITSYIRALDQLDAYVTAEGPFDGVLAFSQGATLAAMHLIRKGAQQAPADAPPFKCAILIACAAVYDPTAYLERGEVRVLEPGRDGHPIRVPTVHVWGEQDPLRDQSRGLSELCEPSLTSVFVHEGGHEVPRLGGRAALAGCVKAVRRGITLATLLEQA